MNKQKAEVLAMWAIAVVIGAVLFAVQCHAQSNSIGIFDGNGKLVYTIPLSAQLMSAIMSTLTALAGVAWLVKIALRFIPTPKPGTVMAGIVAFLKVLGAVTPEKHQADVSVSQPTDNGINPGTATAQNFKA